MNSLSDHSPVPHPIPGRGSPALLPLEPTWGPPFLPRRGPCLSWPQSQPRDQGSDLRLTSHTPKSQLSRPTSSGLSPPSVSGCVALDLRPFLPWPQITAPPPKPLRGPVPGWSRVSCSRPRSFHPSCPSPHLGLRVSTLPLFTSGTSDVPLST